MFGIERFFDRAKGVAVAAGAASLLAIGGVVTLSVSAAMTLQMWMPGPAAYAVTGVGFLSVAAIAMWVGVQPKKPEKHEQPEEVDPTRAVLAMLDLPVEVAKQILKERPVAATVAIAGLGLLIARRPQVALGMVDKLIERFSGGNQHL
ncbi:MAG: phage holin family protein [Hyphomonadaceae bacterium]|nr:phage holin family protein [Hyphomonadaceae bacterium]